MTDTKTVMGSKRFVRVLTKAKGVRHPLRVNQLLVYSFLVNRAGGDRRRTYSQRQLSRILGLGINSFKTIRKVLLKYNLLGLTESGRWYAKKPEGESEGWFACKRTGGGEWYKRFAYWVCYLPAKGTELTLCQIAVWSALVSYTGSRKRSRYAKGLGVTVGVTAQTAASAVKRLRELDLIGPYGEYLVPLAPTAEALGWFRDRPKTEKKEVTQVGRMPLVDDKPPPPVGWDRFKSRLRDEYEYTPEDVDTVTAVFNEYRPHSTVDEVRELLHSAENQHDRKLYPGSSARLLVSKMRTFYGEMKKAREYREWHARMRA